jgi:hypothetical protein
MPKRSISPDPFFLVQALGAGVKDLSAPHNDQHGHGPPPSVSLDAVAVDVVGVEFPSKPWRV